MKNARERILALARKNGRVGVSVARWVVRDEDSARAMLDEMVLEKDLEPHPGGGFRIPLTPILHNKIIHHEVSIENILLPSKKYRRKTKNKRIMPFKQLKLPDVTRSGHDKK